MLLMDELTAIISMCSYQCKASIYSDGGKKKKQLRLQVKLPWVFKNWHRCLGEKLLSV